MSIHPEDREKLQRVIDWISAFGGDNVRQSGRSVYVGSNPPQRGFVGENWHPQQYRVKSEEQDYLICVPYYRKDDVAGDTEIKIAKPLDMRGGESNEMWGVTPAYVPEVSTIYAAPFLDNGATDDEDEPILLMDMNLEGRTAAEFWAQITGSTADGTNKWTYDFTEQAHGVDGFSDLSNGRTGSATLINSVEASNDGTGVQGNGVDIDGTIFTDNTGLEIQPIQGDPVVRVFRTYDTDGNPIYAFSLANAVDGACG